MRIIKKVTFGLLVAMGSMLALEINALRAGTLHPAYYLMAAISTFIAGAICSRFISWGFLIGAVSGAILGFYSLLLVLAFLWPVRTYEDGLIYLLIAAGTGALISGAVLPKVMKRLVARRVVLKEPPK